MFGGSYSYLPNKRGDSNKQRGWQIYAIGEGGKNSLLFKLVENGRNQKLFIGNVAVVIECVRIVRKLISVDGESKSMSIAGQKIM